MAINWSKVVYAPTQNAFARPVTFTPVASQPNVPTYDARGIYNTEPLDVLAEEGSIFSEQRTILDILDEEYSVVPIQGDQLSIPAHIGMPALGDFEIIDVKANGGGETSLSIRKLLTEKP